MISHDHTARLLQKLSPLSDEQWLELLIESIKNPSLDDVALPGFPPEPVQRNIVGSAGKHALREAFIFYLEVKGYARLLGKTLSPDSKILDFGCGWGRIIRFFLKDIKAENLHGIDVDPSMIGFCKELFPYGNFSTGKPLPPAELPDESMDIIYAYSVFSHLSEPAHLQWIGEFSRILKPGGLLVATTQPRSFIEFCRSLHGRTHESSWHNTLSNSFLDAGAAFLEYDSGRFVFSATGGGPALPNSFYGEALIPREYVEREWTKHFIFRDFVDDRNRQPQALIVMQKPDNDLREYADRLKAVMTEKDVRIHDLEYRLARVGTPASAPDAPVPGIDQRILELESSLRERESDLERIYRSRGWKALTVYYKVRDMILRRQRRLSMGLFSRKKEASPFVLSNEGHCITCDSETVFSSRQEWLRDYYICEKCGSIPRERALMFCLERYYPNWRELDIHESSPSQRGVSLKLKDKCPRYLSSHFFPDFPAGQMHPSGFRNENLESLTFPDGHFDLMITQDVMEHIFDPAKAFSEIGRVLKPGGAHIFSVPLINKEKPSALWARRDEKGDIVYIQEPEYHGNPIDQNGSLVTMHWGYDICDFIFRHSGLYTTVNYIDNVSLGIRAEYIEILVSRKV
jgi:ubiquinone/menaquinone biosynthesis C-methylase UbiE